MSAIRLTAAHRRHHQAKKAKADAESRKMKGKKAADEGRDEGGERSNARDRCDDRTEGHSERERYERDRPRDDVSGGLPEAFEPAKRAREEDPKAPAAPATGMAARMRAMLETATPEVRLRDRSAESVSRVWTVFLWCCSSVLRAFS